MSKFILVRTCGACPEHYDVEPTQQEWDQRYGTKDGGPAFPFPSVKWVDSCDPGLTETLVKSTQGMSLRDYFAAQALSVTIDIVMAGLAAGLKVEANLNPAVIAHNAYAVADAMLKAREESAT